MSAGRRRGGEAGVLTSARNAAGPRANGEGLSDPQQTWGCRAATPVLGGGGGGGSGWQQELCRSLLLPGPRRIVSNPGPPQRTCPGPHAPPAATALPPAPPPRQQISLKCAAIWFQLSPIFFLVDGKDTLSSVPDSLQIAPLAQFLIGFLKKTDILN